MNQVGILAAAEAVFDAERALRRAADTVEELGGLAASSLRVLDEAATDAFYAHQEFHNRQLALHGSAFQAFHQAQLAALKDSRGNGLNKNGWIAFQLYGGPDGPVPRRGG